MNIEDRINIGIIYKYYGKLLTQKQQDIVAMYVDNNLSYAEIGEEMGISRQAVKYALDKAVRSLISFENKLTFVSRDSKIKKLMENNKFSKQEILDILEE